MEMVLTPMRDDERDEVARFLSLAFTSTREDIAQWITVAGPGHFRVLRDGGRAVSCLLKIPMGQFIGGRSVPLMGIAGVAVPPEFRGRGYARRMMQLALAEARADGFALSGLYASTQTLYRSVGYEQSAHRFRIHVPMASMGVTDRTGGVVPLTEEDMPAVKECHRRFAGAWDGTLDRGEYLWARVKSNRGVAYSGYGIRGSSGLIDGYVWWSATRKPDTGRHDMELSDLAFTSESACRRILGFLADFGSMADGFSFHGGPTHPALLAMPQQRFTITSKDFHLTRVVDVRRALEGRGYQAGVDAEFSISVADEVIPENNGPFTVKVSGGRAVVEPGGLGRVRMQVRALASILGGFVTPRQAALLGWVEGDEASIATLEALRASTPWVSEMY
ncbi:MAG: GNAT family N-acetyltransferase [Phycisphaeraceae bacterium]|nr:GNAT family N-acetyltransferase [Phycisphaerae bacterium]MBX3391659.1 GNAT family N-acetyltransferase [Phycisphaeraceae bacterium]